MISIVSCKKETAKIAQGINPSNMDTLISPKNNFFNYVNSNWLKNTEIPSNRTSWGSFNELRKRTDADALKNLIKTNTHSPGMYRAYMPLQNYR